MLPLFPDVRCTILPGRPPFDRSAPALYNTLYQYWRKTWGEIFTQSGSPSSLNAQNFLRQDMLICLHHKDEPVGLITMNLFNLSADPTFDHAYLQPFPKELIEGLRARREGYVTTAEYLSVHPEFRRSNLPVSLSEVLIGLSLKAFLDCGAQMTLATTVRPARVHESCAKFGWIEAGTVQKYGLDCVLLYNMPSQIKEHPDPQTARWIEIFWNSRTIWSQTELNPSTQIRRAA